jgi:hypothetical protein
MKRRLPIGIQDFASIRKDGYCYVDKTERIHELLTGSGKTFFLSRPRRFGKSLLCSTLGAIFEGRRELFAAKEGQPALAIDSLDWGWKKHPVIRLDLNAAHYEEGIKYLDARLYSSLADTAQNNGLVLRGEVLGEQFLNLIRDMQNQTGQKAAIIIDEYDKPLLSTIGYKELHQKIRVALKAFYGVLKSADEHLQFVLLTGVTKFSQVSIFSDLNQLMDLSLDPQYADICGITQEELERDFESEIRQIAADKNLEKDEYLAELKRFYNGYRFSRKALTVYNPFGLLNHINSGGEFDTFWFATGTPTFLMALIENQKVDILNLERDKVTVYDFYKFDVDNMDVLAVLYQSGYLTIVDYDEEGRVFTLDYPNEEVRSSFSRCLLESCIHVSDSDVRALIVTLPKLFRKGDIEGVMQALIPFFAEIPYDLQIKQEKYYQTIVHLVFRMLGLYCQSEVKTAAGRIDSVVETKQFVYCFEFKLNGSAEEALRQIDDKGYLLPWQGSGKTVLKIGVEFDREKRNIGSWKVVS